MTMKVMGGDDKLRAGQPVPRQIMLVVLGAAIVLLVPLTAMQFTNEVSWGALDFAAAGALLVGAGVTYVLGARKLSKARYKAVLGVVLALLLFLVWAELAVGIFGTPFAGT